MRFPKKLSYPNDFINNVLNIDCMEGLKSIPDKSVDIVATSPPYNLAARRVFSNKENWNSKWKTSKLENHGYDTHSDYMPEFEYVRWQIDVLNECMRVLKDDGAIFYNHKWRVQKGLIQDRHEIVKNFPVRQIIIWNRSGGVNFNKGYFLPTYEVIYLIAKPKFNLPPKINAYGDIWRVNQEKYSWHPAPFPLELALRMVRSTNGNVILDPFAGSGTIPLACKVLDKQYIAFEKSKLYTEKAIERINSFVVDHDKVKKMLEMPVLDSNKFELSEE